MVLVSRKKYSGTTSSWYTAKPDTTVTENMPKDLTAFARSPVVSRAMAIRLATPIGVTLDTSAVVSNQQASKQTSEYKILSC